MVTLEQVEKLREHANISYDEAKAALENADGDILQALIDLERQGRITPPQGGGRYNSGSIAVSADQNQEGPQGEKTQNKNGEKSAFSRNMSKFFRWLGEIIHKGNINALVMEKRGASIMRLPLTIVVLLVLLAPWLAFLALTITLLLSFRYHFEGPDINTASKVNDAMNTVADAAEEIKNDMKR